MSLKSQAFNLPLPIISPSLTFLTHSLPFPREGRDRKTDAGAVITQQQLLLFMPKRKAMIKQLK